MFKIRSGVYGLGQGWSHDRHLAYFGQFTPCQAWQWEIPPQTDLGMGEFVKLIVIIYMGISNSNKC